MFRTKKEVRWDDAVRSSIRGGEERLGGVEVASIWNTGYSPTPRRSPREGPPPRSRGFGEELWKRRDRLAETRAVAPSPRRTRPDRSFWLRSPGDNFQIFSAEAVQEKPLVIPSWELPHVSG
jgi:hypothetical protein